MSDDLKHWILNHAPDLRITKDIVGDRRVCCAVFTAQGIRHELGPTPLDEDDPDSLIVRMVADAICETIGEPSLFAPVGAHSLQQEIIRASLAGDDAAVKALTTEYVTRSKLKTIPRQAGRRWTV